MMSDKRSYSEILASVETHFIYINNHLKNIDSHMDKINNTNLEQEIKIHDTGKRIDPYDKWSKWILGITGTLMVAIVLKLFGVY